jgi:transposase-like protein
MYWEGTEMDNVTIRGAKAQHNLMEWSQRVADCRNSGQSVSRWCSEHNINPKTYYNWQKKVFAAMVEQQQLQLEAPQESKPRFAELQPPAVQNNLVAAVRIGEVSLDVYSGASAEVVTALCKALRNVK